MYRPGGRSSNWNVPSLSVELSLRQNTSNGPGAELSGCGEPCNPSRELHPEDRAHRAA